MRAVSERLTTSVNAGLVPPCDRRDRRVGAPVQPGTRAGPVVGRQSSRSYARPMSEASVRRGDDESELTFVVDVPEGWCPPPAAARAILRVMLAVKERRENSGTPDRRGSPDPLARCARAALLGLGGFTSARQSPRRRSSGVVLGRRPGTAPTNPRPPRRRAAAPSGCAPLCWMRLPEHPRAPWPRLAAAVHRYEAERDLLLYHATAQEHLPRPDVHPVP